MHEHHAFLIRVYIGHKSFNNSLYRVLARLFTITCTNTNIIDLKLFKKTNVQTIADGLTRPSLLFFN